MIARKDTRAGATGAVAGRSIVAIALLCLTVPGLATVEVTIGAIDVTGLPLVKAHVSVTDGDGQAIKGLRTENFQLSQTPQGTRDTAPIVGFSANSVLEGSEKLAIALMVDRSGSMKSKIGEAKQAVAEFIDRLSDGDQVAVYSFADKVQPEIGFTQDLDAALRAAKGIETGGDTSLYDAAMAAVEAVKDAPATRKAVVLLTDGQQTTGKLTKPDEITKLARDSDVRVFTIGLGNKPEHEILQTMAEGARGQHFRAGEPEQLRTIYQKIADELQNEYVITFNQGPDNRSFDLTVQVEYLRDRDADTRSYRPASDTGSPPPPPGPDDKDREIRIAALAVLGAAGLLLIAVIVIAVKRRG